MKYILVKIPTDSTLLENNKFAGYDCVELTEEELDILEDAMISEEQDSYGWDWHNDITTSRTLICNEINEKLRKVLENK